jgi:hypothetical protein
MSSITPQNGRVSFVADHDPHTYWELQDATTGGTNYGTDTSGNDNISGLVSGDFATQQSYNGMSTNNNPPSSGWMDIYIVTDFGFLIYLPSTLSNNQVYGIFHNGGGTHGQGVFIRQSDAFGGVEVAITHNSSGTPQDWVRILVPDADLDGWHCISGQFASSGGSQGDMAGWLNGTKVVSGTRSVQLNYGSGNPQLGDANHDAPLAANCLDPSSYTGGNWGAEATINSSGILIANFWCDNPNRDNTAPDGLGDTAHEDFYSSHVQSAAEITGTAAGTWPGWAGTSSATVTPGSTEHAGTAAGTWPGWAGTTTAIIEHSGTASSTWPGWTGTATGSIITDVAGTASSTWPGWTGTAVGEVEATVSGVATGTWAGWAGTSTATVEHTATATGALGGWAGTAVGEVEATVSGVATGTWAGWAGTATTTVEHPATAACSWSGWTGTAIAANYGVATGIWPGWAGTATFQTDRFASINTVWGGGEIAVYFGSTPVSLR